jgi:hypothetical protein
MHPADTEFTISCFPRYYAYECDSIEYRYCHGTATVEYLNNTNMIDVNEL